jgi:hypothetical protein
MLEAITKSFLGLLLIGCFACGSSLFDPVAGKEKAKSLTAEGKWIIPERNGLGSNQSSECLGDIIRIDLRSISGNKTDYIWIDKSNSQFGDYQKLKSGDVVSFQTTDQPVQEKCSSGAFVVLKK